MTAAMLLLGALLAQGHGAKAGVGNGGGGAKKTARASETQRRTPAPTPTPTAGGESGGGADRTGGSDDGGKSAAVEGGGGTGKNFKSKTYNFGAMDVEGKLKTPQLLYFLNRVKLELDMSAPDTRSFMKELEKSADDKSL